MSAHDQPGLSNITNLAVAVAFLQRVLSVHEIASCDFDSASSDRTCSEPRAHPCRRRAAAWVARKWTRWQGQVRSRRAACRCSHDHVDIRCISGHLEDVGGICPLSSDDPWRAAPSALERHMPAAQLQARGITEILTAAAKNALHNSGRSGALPPSLCTASRGF